MRAWPGTIALRRTPLAASVRGIFTLNGALMSLGGVGRGFEGMQGLDLQQEHDFVLALAESAGVPSGRTCMSFVLHAYHSSKRVV